MTARCAILLGGPSDLTRTANADMPPRINVAAYSEMRAGWWNEASPYGKRYETHVYTKYLNLPNGDVVYCWAGVE